MRNGSRPYITSLSRGHDDHATFRATLQQLEALLAAISAGCGRPEHGREVAEESDRSGSENRTDGASFPHPARDQAAAKSQHSLTVPDLIQHSLRGTRYRALGYRTQSFVDQGWPGERMCQTIKEATIKPSLREPRPIPDATCRIRGRLQFRLPVQGARQHRASKKHCQELNVRDRSNHRRLDLPDAGTERLGMRNNRIVGYIDTDSQPIKHGLCLEPTCYMSRSSC